MFTKYLTNIFDHFLLVIPCLLFMCSCSNENKLSQEYLYGHWFCYGNDSIVASDTWIDLNFDKSFGRAYINDSIYAHFRVEDNSIILTKDEKSCLSIQIESITDSTLVISNIPGRNGKYTFYKQIIKCDSFPDGWSACGTIPRNRLDYILSPEDIGGMKRIHEERGETVFPLNREHVRIARDLMKLCVDRDSISDPNVISCYRIYAKGMVSLDAYLRQYYGIRKPDGHIYACVCLNRNTNDLVTSVIWDSNIAQEYRRGDPLHEYIGVGNDGGATWASAEIDLTTKNIYYFHINGPYPLE